MSEVTQPVLEAVDHTPGPWSVGGFQANGYLNNRTINPYIGVTYGSEVVTLANARRIVACVNALAGVSTADIDSGAVRDLVECTSYALHCLSITHDHSECEPDCWYNALKTALAKFDTMKGE